MSTNVLGISKSIPSSNQPSIQHFYMSNSSTQHALLPCPHLSSAQVSSPTPVLLAPIRRTAEIRTSAAEVRPTAAQPGLALPVHNGPARLALGAVLSPRDRGLRRRLLTITLSVTFLAPVAAVQSLVLDVVLGPAVAGAAAAAVEVAVCAGAGAGYAALGVAADVDDGDGGGEGLRGAGRCGGAGGGLESSSRLLGGAGGAGGGEGLQAGGGVAVVLGGAALECMLAFWSIGERLVWEGTYPSVLRAAVVVLALHVPVLRTAVLRVDGGEDGRSQREKSDSSELHYEYKIKNPFLEIGMSVSSNE